MATKSPHASLADLLRQCLKHMRELDVLEPGVGYAPWLAEYLGQAAGLSEDELRELTRLMIGDRR